MVEKIKFIKLTQGKYAIVDAERYKELSCFKWALHQKGHAIHSFRNKIKKKTASITMHRCVIRPSQGAIVDHINGDKTDNRISNLRICTNQQNTFNQKLRNTNKSGYKGVHWNKEKNKWCAQIRAGRKIHLGQFECPKKAALAYDAAAKTHHGEFARLNFTEEV